MVDGMINIYPPKRLGSMYFYVILFLNSEATSLSIAGMGLNDVDRQRLL
jgi:hypothetical protein